MSQPTLDRKVLREKLKEYFGFTSFKGNQEEVILNLLSGRDTIVLMPTGGGKSLCYQLPALMMDGVAIIISPLIALMKNQVDSMRTFSTESGIAHFLNSSLNKAAINQVRSDLGTNFCRRCNYCQPCAAGSNISGVFLFEGFLSRYGLADWAKGRYATLPVKASACIGCGACEDRCPYHLPIRKMLKAAAEKFGE